MSDRIRKIAHILWAEIYETSFRGKSRGRFALTRDQLKRLLGVKKLHGSTIRRLQEAAFEKDLVMVDLDEVFAFVEADVLRKYRRPPLELIVTIAARFGEEEEDEVQKEEEEEDVE